ncbi:MAG: C69 family dipeptidase [Chloroflexota bacterium]
MCDTSVAMGSATANGVTIFTKNSDRSPNECQALFHAPRGSFPAGTSVRCQYLELPQVARTWEVIGARPWWLWGFETGVNEWGVAIGNEAVLSKEPMEPTGLLGMDLVRLGLERGRTAAEAKEVITELLTRYGQGGSAEYGGTRYYHNSFIIADPREAWVLETAGRHWAAQRVEGARAISNVYTIETGWDDASPDLVEYAEAKGWWDRRQGEFNFARAYQDFEPPYAPRNFRYQRAQQLLTLQRNRVSVETMQAHARDHYEGSFLAPRWAPQELLFSSICMHTSSQYPGETASGIVAELREGDVLPKATVWHCFGSPCLSVFHPCYLPGVGLPAVLDEGTNRYDPNSPWWVFERLQRKVDANPSLGLVLQSLWRPLERRWLEQSHAVEARAAELYRQGQAEAASAVLRQFVDSAVEKMLAVARQEQASLDALQTQGGGPAGLQGDYREALNTAAGLPE